MLTVLSAFDAGATLLSDDELYFDPESAPFDFYPRVLLPDLSMEDTYTWPAGGDPVLDADILPVLAPGIYPLGYPFSQDDYFQTPNVDYYADLTDGTLTATFLVSAQYLVRVTRASGSQIYTVFAETGLLELPGSEDPTGPSQAISGPEGDVIIVATGDAVVDQAAVNITDEGKNVQRANSVQDTINEIRAASIAAGRKIHVELVGHGAPGMISMNDGSTADGDLIGPDIPDIQAFQDSIDAYCNNISLFSCRSAEGTAGDDLLQTLANSIGIASGWTVPITVEDGYFNVELRAESLALEGPGLSAPESAGSMEDETWGGVKDEYR